MRHGDLKFGSYADEDWQYIKDVLSTIDFDPYEPDWRDK